MKIVRIVSMLPKNCKQCGKMASHLTRGLCSDCYEKREVEYLAVRDFIKDNPKVAIQVVVEATGVEERRVREFVRAGLLEAADMDGFPLECIKCGKPISRGAYCPLCQQSISSGIKVNREPEAAGSAKSLADKKSASAVLQFRKKK
jgi:predicted amidophosphoribosyltransferase